MINAKRVVFLNLKGKKWFLLFWRLRIFRTSDKKSLSIIIISEILFHHRNTPTSGTVFQICHHLQISFIILSVSNLRVKVTFSFFLILLTYQNLILIFRCTQNRNFTQSIKIHFVKKLNEEESSQVAKKRTISEKKDVKEEIESRKICDIHWSCYQSMK